MLIFLAAAALALLTAYWIIRSRGKRPREDGAVPVLAEVVAVETKARDTADGLRNSPAVLLTLEFSFDGAGLRRQLEWQHGRAVKPGDKLPLLYEPLTGRLRMEALSPRRVGLAFAAPAAAVLAALLAWLIWPGVSELLAGEYELSERGGGILVPALLGASGVFLFVVGIRSLLRYSALKRRVEKGELQAVPAAFLGYHVVAGDEDDEFHYPVYLYREGGEERRFTSGLASRRPLEPGQEVTLYRDPRSGKIYEPPGGASPMRSYGRVAVGMAVFLFAFVLISLFGR